MESTFSELHYSRVAIVFLTVYTVYAANKIIWFSLRKNRYCSVIYGCVRRFFDTYVRCFCIGFVPFCVLDSIFFYDTMGTAFNPKYFSFWNIQEMISVGVGFYVLSIVLSSFLVALISAQRLIIACYPAITKKPIGKIEDNASFWRHTVVSAPVTFYVIIHYFALIIWEFCYRIAMFILFLTPWFLVSYTWYFLYTKRLPDVFDASGWLPIIFGILLHIAVCYLAFSIIMRRLFGVITLFIQRSLRQSTG